MIYWGHLAAALAAPSAAVAVAVAVAVALSSLSSPFVRAYLLSFSGPRATIKLLICGKGKLCG